MLRMFLIATAGLMLGAITSDGQAGGASPPPAPRKPAAVPPVLRFRMASLAGQQVDLARYHGQVLLIVNTASKCGFTPQYKALEALYERYRPRGFAVLGFPANNFLWQEPGTNAQIGEFCHKNYGVTFDMFAKISVRGDDKAPLYRFLTEDRTDPKFGGEIRWNFTKFLIGRDGEIADRFGPTTSPDTPEVVAAIEAALARPPAG